jgi:hypothetical protein
MRQNEPEFAMWEHVTITKDPRTGLGHRPRTSPAAG